MCCQTVSGTQGRIGDLIWKLLFLRRDIWVVDSVAADLAIAAPIWDRSDAVCASHFRDGGLGRAADLGHPPIGSLAESKRSSSPLFPEQICGRFALPAAAA